MMHKVIMIANSAVAMSKENSCAVTTGRPSGQASARSARASFGTRSSVPWTLGPVVVAILLCSTGQGGACGLHDDPSSCALAFVQRRSPSFVAVTAHHCWRLYAVYERHANEYRMRLRDMGATPRRAGSARGRSDLLLKPSCCSHPATGQNLFEGNLFEGIFDIATPMPTVAPGMTASSVVLLPTKWMRTIDSWSR